MSNFSSSVKIYFQKIYLPLIKNELSGKGHQTAFRSSVMDTGSTTKHGKLFAITNTAAFQGKMEWATNILLRLGIPHNFYWEPFTEDNTDEHMEGGVEYYRPDRDDGDSLTTTVHDSMRYLDVKRLYSLLNKHPDKLKREITNAWEDIQDKYPLENLPVPDRLKPAIAAVALRRK